MRVLVQTESTVNSPSESVVNFQSTKDFDEQAVLLDGWNQGYAQLSSGGFEGYVSEMRFDGLHLFMEYSSQSLFQNGQLPEDLIAVGVPLQFNGNGLFCGSTCNHQSMHIFSGENGFEFFSPTQLIMGGMVVKRAQLEPWLSEQDIDIINSKTQKSRLMPLEIHKAQSVRSFMMGAFDMVSQTPQLLHQTNIKHSLTKTVMSLLAEGLVDSISTLEDKPTSLKCWKIINDTRELVQQHADSPLSVADVCKVLGISRRTLQYCFQNLLNTNPATYLRAERLNGVRRMLRTSHSVTEAAAHWGFWHFGHFSQEYKKMFGELPSLTYKRLHGMH